MLKDTIETIGKEPTRAMEWPMWLAQAFGGLWILSPFFSADDAPNGNLAAAGDIVALKAYGLVLLLIGLAGIVGLLKRTTWAKAYKLRSAAAFASFFVFSYFVLLRIILEGAGNLAWTTYAINTCLAAVVYLRIKWEYVK